jgi:hypothetical protein
MTRGVVALLQLACEGPQVAVPVIGVIQVPVGSGLDRFSAASARCLALLDGYCDFGS